MHECVLCNEAITNPICPDCLANEMTDWVFARPKLVQLVKAEAMITNSYSHGSTKCIKCSKSFAVCTYCFTENVLDSISMHDQKLGKDFLMFFNFREILLT